MHKLGIIHRDLKPENVLVDENFVPLVMDFGLSKISDGSEKTKTMRVGTSMYMSPEVLSGHYDERIDCFSFSVLSWTVLCLDFNPYGLSGGNSFGVELKVANENIRPPLDKLPKDAEWMKNILERGWGPVNDRPSMKEIHKILSEKVYRKSTVFQK